MDVAFVLEIVHADVAVYSVAGIRAYTLDSEEIADVVVARYTVEFCFFAAVANVQDAVDVVMTPFFP